MATLIAPRSDRPNTAFSTETNQSESSYSSYLISGPLFISWVLLVTLVLGWPTYVGKQKCTFLCLLHALFGINQIAKLPYMAHPSSMTMNVVIQHRY